MEGTEKWKEGIQEVCEVKQDTLMMGAILKHCVHEDLISNSVVNRTEE